MIGATPGTPQLSPHSPTRVPQPEIVQLLLALGHPPFTEMYIDKSAR